ncbi:MAG: hypothetical protein LUF30_05210 [Lachnospiraceae bacterium]|nr:hypothetical protein [Lachnospiraceae bacterium]
MNIEKNSEKNKLLVNIQIPFCTGHCKYCTMKSYGKDRALFHRYLSALKNEISSASSDLENYELASVHIRGDNLLSMMSVDALDDFLRFLRQTLPSAKKTQWILEMLPYEMSAASLTVLRNAHLDVLHLNVGTCQMKEFDKLERPYYYAAFDGALSMISMYQQDNISIGLLAGLPGQTEESLLRSIQYAMRAQPMQLSLQACTPDVDVLPPSGRGISRPKDEDATRRGISCPKDEDATRRGISCPKDEDATRRGQDAPLLETLRVSGAAEVEATFLEAADACLADFGLYRYGDGWHYAIPGKERLEYSSGVDRIDCIGFGAGALTQMDGCSYHNTENLAFYLEHSTEPAYIACDIKTV